MRVSLLVRGIAVLCATAACSTGLALLIHDGLISPPTTNTAAQHLGLTRLGSLSLVDAHLQSVQDRYHAISTTPQFRATLQIDDVPTLAHYAGDILRRQRATHVVFQDTDGRARGEAGVVPPGHEGEFLPRTAVVAADDEIYAVAVVALGAPEQRVGKLIAVEMIGPETIGRWLEAEKTAMADTRWSLVAGGAASITAALIASLVLWRGLVGPLRRVGGTAKRIGAGEFSTRVGLQQNDELGDLSRAIDEMADHLEHHDRHLNAEVRRRTEDLRLAVRRAKKASRAKSEFLARMSHEIRTPLNGVLGMAELLISSGLKMQQRRWSETITRSGNDLLSIINDILDFSKIEAGKMELSCVEFDVRALVEDRLELSSTSADVKGIDLFGRVATDLPIFLRGDPERISQILTNLIGNAIKFTEAGEVSVAVSANLDDRDTIELRFDVTDTGVGIPQQLRDRIFESFTQADGSTTRVFGGTGLGLTIARQLSTMMGGGIGVESTPGSGSRFWFTAHVLPTAEVLGPTANLPRLSFPLHCLLVADRVGSLGMLRQLLEESGATCDVATSEKEALARVDAARNENDGYDVAILEARTDGMNGLEMANSIRQLGAAVELPVLLLTSGLNTPPKQDVAAAGITELVCKPVRRLHFLSALEAATGRTATAEAEGPRSSVDPLRFCADILLVEDNEINQIFAQAVLKDMGCSVVLAENGAEAMEQTRDGSFDLILMDLQMPIMGGLEATRAIRERDRDAARTEIPILALTADAIAGDRESCLEAGMNDYVSKPFTRSQLFEAMRKWLPLRDSANAGPEPEPIVEEEDTPEVESEVLDVRVLDEIRLMDPSQATLARLIDSYQSKANQSVARIREAVEEGDPNALARAAHAFKSPSGNVGATQLTALCKQLEQIGREGSTKVESLVEDVERELDRVRRALDRVCPVDTQEQ